jgi:exopolyphosphatase/guanosine-5'-triphosphate,3'-diphosphate pyrophosphatase
MITGSYDIIYGVGGTVRSAKKLHNIAHDLPEANGSLDVEQMRDLVKKLKEDDRESLDQILQIVPDRVHTIVPGLLILREVAARFECKQVRVSEFGVREGYLYDKVLKEKVLDV